MSNALPASAVSKTVAGLLLRPVAPDDLGAITGIYGHHVRTGTASFEAEAPDRAEMARRCEALTLQGYPYLVAEKDGALLGYAYVSAYRPRAAYRDTVENSIYLRPDATGQGLGSRLLAALIEACEHLRYRQMIAVIGGQTNLPSIHLHLRHGFRHVGVLRAVGYKHGQWLDTVLLQRSLGFGDTAPPTSTACSAPR
ncbi:GNAT family N-acetyltransferase [Roseomonas sp. HJA6]|uniref:GNAT family N-acetyltransferase n=1 Tax=Roseomonas alba TaxID=2846776 RepID=A0ABS7ACA4_9PROT|nr:GNAT family N-acetyltransferase [Neoroseomonas alba]MBW6399392.1 GNAT family N-acetyltransferase [Neoroseomonas alba]